MSDFILRVSYTDDRGMTVNRASMSFKSIRVLVSFWQAQRSQGTKAYLAANFFHFHHSHDNGFITYDCTLDDSQCDELIEQLGDDLIHLF